MNAETPEKIAVRQLADHMISRLDNASRGAIEQLVKTSGWLNASLLVINGGGALAMLNVVDRLPHPVLPGLMFGLGILTSLLIGVVIQDILNKQNVMLGDAGQIWIKARVNGVRDEKAERGIADKVNRLNARSWIPQAIGWVSGGLFFAGAVSLGWQLSNIPSGEVRATCRILQNDMLAARPSLQNSRENFVALGCRASDRAVTAPKGAAAPVHPHG